MEYGEGDEMIAVLGHLDIVPAGDGWTYPPFEGRIADGKIYGRGTTDDKGPLIASLFALKAIKDAGIKLKRRIRIIFGTDEESGSHDMIRYKETEELPVMAFTQTQIIQLSFLKNGWSIFKLTRNPQADSAKWTLAMAKGGNVVNQVPDSAAAAQRGEEQIHLQGKVWPPMAVSRKSVEMLSTI